MPHNLKSTDEQLDLVERLEWWLDKALPYAIFDAVGDIFFWNERIAKEGKESLPIRHVQIGDEDEFADDAFLLPDGRVAAVSWNITVMTKAEFCGEA